MNKIILIGNLAADPEARTTQSGISQSTFRIAVQRRFANAQGVREADFFTVIAWRQTADFCNRYLTKGRKVAVEGSIQNRSYDAQDGSKRYVTEIIADSVEAVGGRDEAQGQARPRDNGPTPPPAPPAGPAMNDFTEVEDDELPF
jgi:single-strand DNA-binding protein